MDPVAIFVTGLMVGSVGILLGQSFGRRRNLAIGQGRERRNMAGSR